MWILFLVSLFVAGCSSAPRHVIMAPDVFYVGVPQKIHVALFDVTSPHDVEVAVRLPSSSKVISSDHALISADSPKLLTVKINPEYILDRGDQKYEYVHLFAKCRGPQLRFNSNVKVCLSYQDGVLLIHTDKPVYTPEGKVLLHVIPLGHDLKPNTKKVKIIVKNPQGTTVKQWQDLVTQSGFIHTFLFLGRPLMAGDWAVDAYYGHLFAHKVSVKFEVQEYILPTFSVKIKGPRYILPTDTYFNVSGKANYSYGKKVVGKVAVRLSILGLHPEPLSVMTYRSLFYESSFSFSVQTKHIKNLLHDKWFPEGHRLQIQADVTEKSTGKTEIAVENSIYFLTKPYRIEYVNTARYFKPGLPFQIKARVSYPNKENAVGIPVKLTVKAHGSSVISIGDMRDITDNEGVITFILNVQRQARRLNIKVETVSQNVKEGQDASKNFTALASESTEVMNLRHYKPAKVGSKTSCEVFMMNFNVNQMVYLVVSRGQIVHSAILKKSFGIITTFSFNVTSSMSPSARLVAYYVSKKTGKIVSDSILLKIEAELPNPIFIVPPSNPQEINLPLESYDLKILGTIGTKVILVGVDQSVYFQSKDNILSPETVFKQLKDSYVDVASGGRNVRDVFKNARMVVISREMTVNAATRTNGNHGRSTRSLGFDLLELDPAYHLTSVIARQHFPKTWFFSEITISKNASTCEDCSRKIRPDFQDQCGSAVFSVSLPDTVTTWVVQTIGVSNTAGFGISKPLHITTFKPFFIYLSMPFSVQRGEEITILATIFNYRNYDDLVHLYLKGDESFCSLASPGKTHGLTSSRIKVKAQSSISYAINLLPIKLGKIPIEVTALGRFVEDRILKELLVVPDVKYNVSHTKESCNYHLNLTVGQGSKQFYYSTSSLSSHFRRIVRPRRAIKKRKNKNRKSKKRRKTRKKRPFLVKEPSTPSELVLTVCTQYKNPGRSGMTVIEVGCLTGYTSSEQTLIKMVNKVNGSISSYRSSDRAVEFFVNEIDSVKPFCITFTMTRVFDVGTVQPVPIKVYDFHEPNKKCTIFYNLGGKKKSVGKCRGNRCRCTQRICPELPSPYINIRRRSRLVCRKYDFAIKGQVVYADEDNAWLTYFIKVTQVIKGKKGLKVNDIIEVRKKSMCIYPHLARRQVVLFIGKMKRGQYIFDVDAFVKKLTHPRDIRDVNELAKRIGKGNCK